MASRAVNFPKIDAGFGPLPSVGFGPQSLHLRAELSREYAVPLVSGEVQFWRMDPDTWRPALDAAKTAGFTVVATYLSWRRHELTPGSFEWGASDRRLNARAFVEACAEAGLLVHLKPGPWICAEEPGGGYPDWLLSDDEVAALDAWGRPVVGYNPPFTHRVPCYRHPLYRAAVRSWFEAVWDELGDLRHPEGPVIAVQLDNEPSHCFSHALYYADYHPLGVAAFRDWLTTQYSDDDALSAAWGQGAVIAEAAAPRPGDVPRVVTSEGTVSRRLEDWVEFCGESITEHLQFLRQLHADLGAGQLLPTVNIINSPVFEVPLSHRAVRASTGAATGVDHYYEPPLDIRDIDRLAKTAAFARMAGEPLVWAPELMAGIWRSPGERVDYPDPTPDEQAAWWGAALALGYQGFNLYMLADRENWEYAPIGEDDRSSGFLAAAHRLAAVIRRTPDVLKAELLRPVALAWHRADAVAAYCLTGTARGGAATHTDPQARRGYDGWAATAFDLLRAGIPYDLVDTSAPCRPSEDRRRLLIPPHCSATNARDFESLGWDVDRLDDGFAAHDLLAEPGLLARPVSLDVGADCSCLATLTRSRVASYIHLVNWGPRRPAHLAIDRQFSAGGWRNLSDGGPAVDLTALNLPSGHTVLARDN